MTLSQQNLYKICKILTTDGDIIATGRISKIEENSVKISNKAGEMPVLDSNTIIKFLVHKDEEDDEVFVALVNSSTEHSVSLKNIELLTNIEKRECFRVSVSMATKCYPDNGSGGLDESKAFKVKVRDLSLRGTLIITGEDLEENDKIYIVLPLSKTEIFKLTVKRKITYLDSVGYGCEFDKYGYTQEDVLCQFVFEEQRKLISKTKSL